MPGLKTCFRCGSVLDGSSVGADIEPPRAPAWKKPFRRAHYWLRRRTVLGRIEKAAEEARLEAAMSRADSPARWGATLIQQAVEAKRIALSAAPWVVVSTLPGLAHLIQRRFRRIFSWWASWLSTLFCALFFFCPRPIPVIMLAMAVILHAWIAADAGLVLKRTKGFAARLVALVLVALWVLVVYAGVRVTALRNIHMGMSVVSIPSLEVQVGDYLLCRRLNARSETIRPGDLVLIDYQGGHAVTQVIGVPGDRVSVTGGRFVVNGKALDAERFPVEEWIANERNLPGGGAGTRRPLLAEEFLVRMRYSRSVRGYSFAQMRRGPPREGPLVVGRRQILARAFMRWMPLARRGFLADVEDAE